MPNPVILVPGITASELRDDYPVSPETVWSLLNRGYDRISLHPDDLRFERDGPARVGPDRPFSIPYGEFVQELRHDLSPRIDRPTPVFAFAYDWRQPLDRSEALFADFVDEVLDRTRLLRHYHDSPWKDRPRVDVVGHSMGGLIVAGYLEARGREGKVGKVATLGTPFRGSLEAPLKVATGLAELGGGEPSSREREAARLTPALYHLLPSFTGAVEAVEGIPADLFDPGAWQPGIVATLAEYVRLHGTRKGNWIGQAGRILREMLEESRRHRERIEDLRLEDAGMSPSDWLCIVGVGETTRVRLEIDRDAEGRPLFDLSSKWRLDQWRSGVGEQRVFTGDGTVPYLGARAPFLPVDGVVCVCPDDFGYWELRDRLLGRVAGLHGLLPSMNLIHRLVAAHFQGAPRKGTWGRRPPDLPEDAPWRPPLAGLQEKG